MKHPMQPLVWDNDVIRFKENAIVRFLLDAGKFDLNDISLIRFSQEDREQFTQLIGYSVSGAGDLDHMSRELIDRADLIADKMYEAKG